MEPEYEAEIHFHFTWRGAWLAGAIFGFCLGLAAIIAVIHGVNPVNMIISIAASALGVILAIISMWLGTRANRIATESSRFNYLHAESDLYQLREDIVDHRKPTWLTWRAVKIMERASAVKTSAQSADRSTMVVDAMLLLRFVLQRHTNEAKRRESSTITWEAVSHTLSCLQMVSDYAEAEWDHHEGSIREELLKQLEIKVDPKESVLSGVQAAVSTVTQSRKCASSVNHPSLLPDNLGSLNQMDDSESLFRQPFNLEVFKAIRSQNTN